MNFSDILLKALEGGDMNIIPVMNIDAGYKVNEADIPEDLPVLALRNAVLFPNTVIPITIGREKSLRLVKESFKSNRIIGAVAQKDIKVEDPIMDDLYRIGTLARIVKLIDMPDGTVTAILQGIKRLRLQEIITYDPYIKARVEYIEEKRPKKGDEDFAMICESIKDSALQIIKMSPTLPQEAGFAIKNIDSDEFLINFVASSIEIENPLDKMPLLEENRLKDRALKLLELLNKQLSLLMIKEDIQQKVKSEIDQQQREYYLNNQLKTIQEELGIGENGEDFDELKEKAARKRWPEQAKATFEKELKRLERINPNAPDYNVLMSYLQFLVELPWEEYTEDNLDLDNAQKILDSDHYGLETVKERIIEYLAVLSLKHDMKSPILCLYGPPGVGKTSLGKSVARALGRKYERVALGGLHDESEIRGHRKTYIGAMPGRILQAINRAGTSNPVIVLDEVDKIGNDYKGDPSSALLEVLDPEQNTSFHDNYLDINYDLSKVLFITTANNISTIQPALRDRMEMIPVSGYLAEEKYYIAKDYLIPKQREAHGLSQSNFKLNKGAIETVINEYTNESGVRGLDKQLAKLARKTARKVAGGETELAALTKKDVKEMLGLPTAQHDLQKGNEAPGVVTGLAWTQNGGEILFVECSLSEGKGVLTTTGNLGDVMKESTMIAFQYIKAHPELAGMTTAEFMSRDMHIHVPEGAIPKDGPSAGITMVSAMVSALRNKKVKSSLAMTGEITLRGKVLPVGGIKEKILAAKRSGVKTIVMSAENEKDINDIKPVYIEGLTFKYVNTISEVIDFIFEQ